MSTRISIELNEPLTAYLDVLVESGMYGADRQEACERIVAHYIEGLSGDGTTPISQALCDAIAEKIGTTKEED